MMIDIGLLVLSRHKTYFLVQILSFSCRLCEQICFYLLLLLSLFGCSFFFPLYRLWVDSSLCLLLKNVLFKSTSPDNFVAQEEAKYIVHPHTSHSTLALVLSSTWQSQFIRNDTFNCTSSWALRVMVIKCVCEGCLFSWEVNSLDEFTRRDGKIVYSFDKRQA